MWNNMHMTVELESGVKKLKNKFRISYGLPPTNRKTYNMS